MENKTKKCPHRGKEIAATAIKCRFCGTWLEKRPAPTAAPPQTTRQEPKKESYYGYSKEYKEAELRQAVEDREDRKRASNLLIIEGGILLGILWYGNDWSGWQALLFIIVSMVLLYVHTLRILFCIGASLLWGAFSIGLAPMVLDDIDAETLQYVPDEVLFSEYWWVGLIVFLAALAAHWPALCANFDINE